jgi:hypothetical protein
MQGSDALIGLALAEEGEGAAGVVLLQHRKVLLERKQPEHDDRPVGGVLEHPREEVSDDLLVAPGRLISVQRVGRSLARLLVHADLKLVEELADARGRGPLQVRPELSPDEVAELRKGQHCRRSSAAQPAGRSMLELGLDQPVVA